MYDADHAYLRTRLDMNEDATHQLKIANHTRGRMVGVECAQTSATQGIVEGGLGERTGRGQRVLVVKSGLVVDDMDDEE
jgi:hypothetical protein